MEAHTKDHVDTILAMVQAHRGLHQDYFDGSLDARPRRRPRPRRALCRTLASSIGSSAVLCLNILARSVCCTYSIHAYARVPGSGGHDLIQLRCSTSSGLTKPKPW